MTIGFSSIKGGGMRCVRAKVKHKFFLSLCRIKEGAILALMVMSLYVDKQNRARQASLACY